MSDGWAIVLAAGAASRFGSPKALAPWQQGTLLSQALATAGEFAGKNIITVLGGHAASIAPQVTRGHTVLNHDWQKGLGSSIKTGLQEMIKYDPSAAVVALLFVDQPLATVGHLQQLAAQAQKSRRCVLTKDGVVRGPPAAIPAAQFDMILKLLGDKGLKEVLGMGDYAVIDAPGMLADIDTPEDLQRLSQTSR